MKKFKRIEKNQKKFPKETLALLKKLNLEERIEKNQKKFPKETLVLLKKLNLEEAERIHALAQAFGCSGKQHKTKKKNKKNQ